MAHDVKETCNHLVLRDRERVCRVEDGEFREDVISEDVADLELLVVVSDDTSAIHFASCSDHS